MTRTRWYQVGAGIVVAGVLSLAGCQQTGAGPTRASRQGQPTTIQDGMNVQIDYTLHVDGKVLDSSQGKAPLSYVQGRHQIVPGLERQLAGLHVGDEKDVTVMPQEGYGQPDPQGVITIPKAKLSPNITPQVGQMLQGKSADGRVFRATIKEVRADDVVLDLNHPLAGKTLQFHIKVVSVAPAKAS